MLFDIPLLSPRKLSQVLRRLQHKQTTERPPPPPRYPSRTDTLDSDQTLVSSHSRSQENVFDVHYARKPSRGSDYESTISVVSGDDFSRHHQDCCIVEVEGIHFTVPKSILRRDRSVFTKILRHESNSFTPIRLAGRAEPFRDLLQVLHAFPNTLPHLDIDSTSIAKLPRLLNVADLSLKYAFSSCELWAVQHIQMIVTNKNFYLPTEGFKFSLGSERVDPDELIGRMLDIAIRGHHEGLMDVLVQKLMTHILWHDFTPGNRITHIVSRFSSRSPALRRLRGVMDYRLLVNLPVRHPECGGHTQPIFPPKICIEKRMRLLAAHSSLTTIWERVSHHPPPISYDHNQNRLPSPHAGCWQSWQKSWFAAAHAVSTPTNGVLETDGKRQQHSCRTNDAAVLGKLKFMMILLKQSVGDSRTICLECSMAGLEAVNTLRDEVVMLLDDMFLYC